MEITKRPWPVLSVCGMQSRIDTRPDYQRPPVWSLSQKQLLLDTILRGYDVPKFYWRKIHSNPDKYEVVDGQQRLRAIFEFHTGKYALAKKAEAIGEDEIAELKYDELPDEVRLAFDTYALDVVVLSDSDEEEVREMFLRLQNGTTLKAQERRNAMSGEMRDFVKSVAKHKFFESCGFTNSRYTFDLVAAQMTLIELVGGPTNVKSADLNRMYEEYAEFDSKSPKARKVRHVLDFLARAFPRKTPELERYSVISLYALSSQLLERYVFKDRYAELVKWFIAFENYRRTQHELPLDKADNEIVTYQEKTSHSTDAEDSIQWRHEFLLRKLFEAIPDVGLKDDQRLFTHEQRLAIYRRDDGMCQVQIKCKGVKCEWDSWEADHIKAWSKGGRTTVANGQVACLACNASKGGRAQAAD